ncbi:MAG: OmpA family protein [Ignavibacteriales bacterium]|nr:OmpA family protein [Ignavibacteriales bacterium]
MKKFGLLLIIIIFFTSNQNFGQFSTFKSNPFSNTIILSLGAGISQNGTDYSTYDLGFTGNGSVEYFFSNSSDVFLGLKLESGYTNLIGNSKSLTPSKFDTEVLSFGPSATLNYKVTKEIFPFIGFGVRNLWYDNFSSFDISTELGLRYLISRYFSINGSIALNFLSEDNIDGYEIARSSKDFYSTYSIGFSYAVDLTVANDIDNDGIENKIDKCPEQEEDFDGFEDTDGCPEFDNDKDGIVDLKDQCVNESEDFDGFEDTDGCPDFDNDGDGILDVDDSCPDLKEDFDGFEDTDGCPEYDNDKDGILDENDKCPNEPETFNNFEDADGCPDEIPQVGLIEEKVEENSIRIAIPNSFSLKGDEIFDGNSATLKSSANNQLDKIASQMKSNPNFSWKIEGHLDNSGTPFELKALSTARANAVLNYFIGKGLDPKMFEALGLADDFPVAPNNTSQGKTKNRRIEIKRIR